MAGHRRSGLRIWAEYLAARSAAAGLNAFPVDLNTRTASAFGRLLHAIDRRHAARALANIRRSFPAWGEAESAAVAQASFEHFTQLVVEVVHTTRLISDASWSDRVKLRGLGPAVERMASDRPVILLTGHLGNWELLGYLMALLGFDLDAIARPLDNPKLNDWVMGIRQSKGLRIITKWDATERMVGVMDKGGSLGFIADQNAGDKGLFVPFLGRLASTYKSIGLLAMNHHASIVCGYAHRLPPTADDPRRFKYEIGTTDVIDPEDWADRRDPLYYITARYSRAIEAMIRLRPEQYLWMHRRWKSRPRHERLGKPMASGLRRNLEELPWMTDELMAAVAVPVTAEENKR